MDRQSGTVRTLDFQLSYIEPYSNAKRFVLVLKEKQPHALLAEVSIPFNGEGPGVLRVCAPRVIEGA